MVKKVVKTTVTEIKEDKPKRKKSSKKSSKKKSTKKRSTKRKSSRKRSTTVVKASPELLNLTKRSFENLEKRDQLLIENFVGLQEAMANLSKKFSELSQNFSNILGVFEIAAKTLAESEKQVDNTLSSKLDTLIDQNRSIANELNLGDLAKRKQMMPPPQQAPPKQMPQQMYTRQVQPVQPHPQQMHPQPQPVPQQQQQQQQAPQGIPPKQLPSI